MWLREWEEIQILLQAMNAQIKVGDVLEHTNRFALAKTIRVTEVTPTHFKAVVLEGDNIGAPITVFQAGCGLYTRTATTMP